jgi:hypothetical protein
LTCDCQEIRGESSNVGKSQPYWCWFLRRALGFILAPHPRDSDYSNWLAAEEWNRYAAWCEVGCRATRRPKLVALRRRADALKAEGPSSRTVAQHARHARRFASWLEAEHLPDDVAALEPEHLARFLASAEALRRPDGQTKRVGSLNALRSSLRGFCAFLETSGIVERSPVRVLRMARVAATTPAFRRDRSPTRSYQSAYARALTPVGVDTTRLAS